MIHVVNLNKSFGAHIILDEVTFAVAPGEKVALVGRNGCGKTTLLHIICGTEPYDSGSVIPGPSCQIGYLGQEGQLNHSLTLYQEMEQVFADVKLLEAEVRSLEEKMAELGDSDNPEDAEKLQSVLNRYGRCRSRLEHSEPELIDAKIRGTLHGLGFTDSDMDRLTSEFSGGWQMRGSMAKLLLREPDLLLLDEPTNHLDIYAAEWLEDYIRKSSATVILVSHDRYFMDRCVSRVLELRQTKIHDYAGNYSFYVEERERRREQQEAAYLNQQKRLKQEMRFVERFRYKASLATRVQSRLKLIDKRELIEAPDKDQRALKAQFAAASASGQSVLSVKNVCKAYGERQVLTGLSLEVQRGERMALVGGNGVGKSTLLRLLAGLEEPDSGKIKAGYKLEPVYYAQHQAESLNMDNTILDEVYAVCGFEVDQTRIRTILGCLLFEGDDVHKEISVLSGGEKSRVALARCILQPSNLLLLDEPTNHLDIESRQALLNALQDYPGTVMIVTHDRFFMNELADVIVEIRQGRAYRYVGNYDDYFEVRRKEMQREAAEKDLQGRPALTKTQQSKNRKAALQAYQEEKRLKEAETAKASKTSSAASKFKWKFSALEKRICTLEEEMQALGERLADPELYSSPDKLKKLREEYDSKQQENNELMAIWEQMAEEQ
ncbi:MAG: ATP-binding cassette domain-containing protein [Candidatus Bruticola sp.]